MSTELIAKIRALEARNNALAIRNAELEEIASGAAAGARGELASPPRVYRSHDSASPAVRRDVRRMLHDPKVSYERIAQTSEVPRAYLQAVRWWIGAPRRAESRERKTTPEAIIAAARRGKSHREIGRELGVSPSWVGKVLRGLPEEVRPASQKSKPVREDHPWRATKLFSGGIERVRVPK